jgi:hypothetical protein
VKTSNLACDVMLCNIFYYKREVGSFVDDLDVTALKILYPIVSLST